MLLTWLWEGRPYSQEPTLSEYQEDLRDQVVGSGEERVHRSLEEQNSFAEDTAFGHVLELSGERCRSNSPERRERCSEMCLLQTEKRPWAGPKEADLRNENTAWG